MRPLSGLLIVLFALPLGGLAGCGDDGAKIEVLLNVRNLCNYGIVPTEQETRCGIDDECDTANNEFCWDPGEGFERGFCRQCETDCPAGKQCDNRFCNTPCSTNADCQSNEFCTGSFCRKPHIDGTNFSFRNTGNKDLEVYLDQTRLVGGQDACVFSKERMDWATLETEEPPATVVLAPDEEGLFLNVRYTPPEIGESRGIVEIHSNATNFQPLLLLFCGQAVAAPCQESIDGVCPECTACTAEDFKPILDNPVEPDCSSFF